MPPSEASAIGAGAGAPAAPWSAVIARPGASFTAASEWDDVLAALRDPDALAWIDVEVRHHGDIVPAALAAGVPEAAVEWASDGASRGASYYVRPCHVLVVREATGPAESPVQRALTVIAMPRALITAHEGADAVVRDGMSRWHEHLWIAPDSIATPLYVLLDSVLDDYFPRIDDFAESVELLQDRFFAGIPDGDPAQIFALRKALLELRRAGSALRDATNALMRHGSPVVADAAMPVMQSLYDRAVRLVETIDTYRDLVTSAMDIHLSVVSNRTNRVMKTLTVLSTILMSCGLVAGIYGMNFDHMPELASPWGYPAALAAMLVLSTGLATAFRRLGWF
ncbi:MAG TPA: CorA family divalent cation transporter [Chthonomonadales bacterium]|nr:CorA family divalent cation transporter [Chthonomonadales bacterium]